jgi:hypothetical protein
VADVDWPAANEQRTRRPFLRIDADAGVQETLTDQQGERSRGEMRRHAERHRGILWRKL